MVTRTSRSRTRRGVRRSTPVLAGLLTVALLTASCEHVPIPGVENCRLTPVNSFWRANVTSLPVHPSSATWIATAGGAGRPIKADFGSGLWDGGPIGIPYDVVPGTAPKRTITFDEPDESDLVGYPVPNPPTVEGGTTNPVNDGDRHVIMVDKDNCRLYETYSTYPGPGSSWTSGVTAFSGATWDMNSNAMRPDTWTSADAAGLPILPGLVRYEEVEAGKVLHAIRMTVSQTRNTYVWPASHKASSNTSTGVPPMGAWLRLKPSVDENNFDPFLRPIIRALKTYGAVIADNGSNGYMSGVPDERWDNDLLQDLGAIDMADFDYIDASSIKVANGSYEATTAG